MSDRVREALAEVMKHVDSLVFRRDNAGVVTVQDCPIGRYREMIDAFDRARAALAAPESLRTGEPESRTQVNPAPEERAAEQTERCAATDCALAPFPHVAGSACIVRILAATGQARADKRRSLGEVMKELQSPRAWEDRVRAAQDAIRRALARGNGDAR